MRSVLDPRPRQGFTLLELMVASSLSLIVLAAAMWSAAELQRRGTFEESLMEAQNTLRAMRDMLVVEMQRSGMGVGSAKMTFGTTPANAPDVRFSINVGTQELFDGTNVSFPRDPNFAGPPTAYAQYISDALQIWSWDTSAVDKPTGTPIGMLSLAECPGGAKSRRIGNELCLLTPPPSSTGLVNRLLMVVKPSSGASCIMRVTSVKTDLTDPRLTIVPGLTNGQAATSGPCMSNPTDLSFWADGSDIFAFLMRGVAFRINWKTQRPTLERMDTSSDTTAPAPNNQWLKLSQDVEMIRLSLGAVNTSYTGDPVQWFPDTTSTPPHGAIDDCTDATCKLLTYGTPTPTSWPPSPDPNEAYEQLMLRVRMVRVQVITRTPRVDSSLIKMNGANFAVDADGYPQDGYKRRSSVLEIMPRNFSYSG